MHDGKFTSFFNNERPLGYKYGPNSISNDFSILITTLMITLA